MKTLYTEETPIGVWRGELLDLLYNNHRSIVYVGGQLHVPDYLLDFIQQQINKAEERGQEKMKQTIIEYIPKDYENADDYQKFYNLALKHCRQSISIS